MQPQERDLSEGMQGNDVALLYRDLDRLNERGLLEAELSADEVDSHATCLANIEAALLFQ